jgi:phosphopantothenate---cysteine ligase (CTP)
VESGHAGGDLLGLRADLFDSCGAIHIRMVARAATPLQAACMDHVVITCGPGHEPIDAVRRITNFATGEIGALLAAEFARTGYSVTCLHGEGSRWTPPVVGVNTCAFTTNADLQTKLSEIPDAEKVRAVFHAAALCDFGISTIENAAGEPIEAGKLSSREGALTLRLHPLPKVLPTLRGLFPGAIIVGWKYEVDGTNADALVAGRAQLAGANTDACVVNGPAYGPGFGLIDSPADPIHFPDKPSLTAGLQRWLAKRLLSAA